MTGLKFSKESQIGDRIILKAKRFGVIRLVKGIKTIKAGAHLNSTQNVVLISDRTNNHESKKGWLEIGGQRHYMRSSWERNYARYLQWLKVNKQIMEWDYEPKRFEFPERHGNNSYLPDFLITENSGRKYWVEIKGHMTQGSRTKLKRFAKYFPEETLILLDQDQYRKLARDVKKLVPGWE